MQSAVRSNTAFPPVSMLVPNPVLVSKAQIGNKDYDLVSELSERISIASSDLSSLSQVGSEMTEEMETEDSRQEREEADQEYTIYDLLPPPRSVISTSGLAWLSVPQDISSHQGKILTLHCAASGDKPIGE